MGIIKYKFDALPEVSDETIARIKAIRDEDIDYSDIPPLTEEFWQNAVRGGLYKLKPEKEKISLNIDKDILIWLKQSGKDYQTRLNAILRRVMIEAQKEQHNQ